MDSDGSLSVDVWTESDHRRSLMTVSWNPCTIPPLFVVFSFLLVLAGGGFAFVTFKLLDSIPKDRSWYLAIIKNPEPVYNVSHKIQSTGVHVRASHIFDGTFFFYETFLDICCSIWSHLESW